MGVSCCVFSRSHDLSRSWKPTVPHCLFSGGEIKPAPARPLREARRTQIKSYFTCLHLLPRFILELRVTCLLSSDHSPACTLSGPRCARYLAPRRACPPDRPLAPDSDATMRPRRDLPRVPQAERRPAASQCTSHNHPSASGGHTTREWTPPTNPQQRRDNRRGIHPRAGLVLHGPLPANDGAKGRRDEGRTVRGRADQGARARE